MRARRSTRMSMQRAVSARALERQSNEAIGRATVLAGKALLGLFVAGLTGKEGSLPGRKKFGQESLWSCKPQKTLPICSPRPSWHFAYCDFPRSVFGA